MKSHILLTILGIGCSINISSCNNDNDGPNMNPELNSVIVTGLGYQTPAIGARKEWALIVESEEILDCSNFKIEADALVAGSRAWITFTNINSPSICNNTPNVATGAIFMKGLDRNETTTDLIFNGDTTKIIIRLGDTNSIEVIEQGLVEVRM